MLRLIIVTFEILVLIMILRSAFVQFWLSDMQASTSKWMHEISMFIDNRELDTFRDGVLSHVKSLSESQLVYLEKVTSSKAELNHFNIHYCKSGDKNPYIYGTNLTYICGEISRTDILDKFN